MARKKINKLLCATALCGTLFSFSLDAKEIDTNIAQMQAMDKITGKVSVIEAPVGGDVTFGSFSIVVRACKTRPPEETPENFAFVDVVDGYNSEKPVNIFRGWMMSSTPGLNAIEHPIYDVWLLKCIDGAVDKSKLLSAEKLKDRDMVEKAPSVEDVKAKNMMESKPEVKAAPEAETPSVDATETIAKEETKVIETAPIDSLGIETSEVVTESPNLPQDMPPSVDDGSPKSLLNIGNFNNAETQVEAPQEPIDDVFPAANNANQEAVETLIINSEIAPEDIPTAEEMPMPPQVLSVDEPAPMDVSGDGTLSAPIVDTPISPKNDNQLINFEEVEEEVLDMPPESIEQ